MLIIMDVVKKIQANHIGINLLQVIKGVGLGRAIKSLISLTGRVDLQLYQYSFKHIKKAGYNINQKSWLLAKHLENLRNYNIRRLKRIRCFRGIRLKNYLPSHGQRTHSNGMNARYLGSKTFDYVPKELGANCKRIASYVRHAVGLKKMSDKIYQKLLRKNFFKYQLKNRKHVQIAHKRGQLGIFKKFMPKLLKDKQKKKKSRN